ncbi:Hsp20/alpha crystallin family protein [Alkalihalobacillus sp. LMS6]|uniref:Hsp20/alpha crystallin family protein n=1 Tax=Alkalihalobacillus sp. LMS6 TaxID=2924034 RepID=UPI0020D11F25|nr:Hsp20/alpha crystallin family protein [Alkalihalobacillus sp. LMS6]UTR04652.1 Hsp20/alpha crystallin family protein [Alkalihalobacillus sp. LMS6]
MKNPFSKESGQVNLLGSIDHFFQQTFKHLPRAFSQAIIPVRVDETKESLIITADLPGIDKQAIHLRCRYQSLVLTVEQTDQLSTLDESGQTVSEQQSISIREREIPVPFLFSEEDIRAHYANGQLTVTIENKQKQIFID